ncbi:RNA polymerase II-associated protein 3 isoform X2 [Cynara cardunculus var. scolymus]|uniref:RNA polymerase II-associated protein 3 isoform X2 n=1 Tax=Cynara cardunculus var. scolymus TaxID=59895 RepID=UPI000D6282A8|nr:RNA polymerase II-associated protein 3 isoform X2 [Cynara cardunculus var. scolymus]
MARVPSKHERDHHLDFEGFLNNLQDWELSLKDKDKKLKSQSDMGKMEPSMLNAVSNSSNLGVNGRSHESKEPGSGNSKIGAVGVDKRQMVKTSSVNHSSTAREEDYLKKYDAVSRLSSGFMRDDSSVDANSEKELGNEFFKQRKYKEAIDCYSRSLALSPTAVAYANRAMAYLKLKRFQEAEDDCTEALNLDDRYIKAYSRRSTARKELGKLKDSKEDADFALRLEPQNQEIKRQYADAKSLYDNELLKKASASLKGPTQQVQKEVKLDNVPRSMPKISETTRVAAPKTESMEPFISSQKNHNIAKKELKESVQQLAARAASLATAEAAKNIVPPTSAYQFEVSWRGFSGDRTLQTRLLKATNPVALPEIFKNALSAPLLIDVIRCIATFFSDDIDLAVKYLENLPKVSRFNMIIMCLPPADKSDLQRIWDEVFCNKEVAADYVEILQQLCPKYCIIKQ